MVGGRHCACLVGDNKVKLSQDGRCAGRPLTSDESEWEVAQSHPNRYWTLLPFLEDPVSISEYMAANCTTQTLGGPTRTGRLNQFDFQTFTGDFGDGGHLNVNDTFDMCVDTFGGYEAYKQYASLRFLTGHA